jgi:hypothetical protein
MSLFFRAYLRKVDRRGRRTMNQRVRRASHYQNIRVIAWSERRDDHRIVLRACGRGERESEKRKRKASKAKVCVLKKRRRGDGRDRQETEEKRK